jgi:hypothetical protein
MVALRQQGSVTYEQLLECGVTARMIAQRYQAGRLYRVHLGVYSVGRPPQTPIEKASAAVLACGPRAALSHLGALALWGFANRWPTSFDAIVQSDRRPAGIATHQYSKLTKADFRTHFGVRTTSPARTLLDSAPRLNDKQRTRTINDALRTPFLTEEQLTDVCTRFPHHPGARLIATVVHGDRTRSPLEDDFPAFCRRYGLPQPIINTKVAGHEVDALFERQKLIVELDGWEFHKDRQAFESDRNRDADTLQAGYATIRITRERIDHRPAAEAARLKTILDSRS